MPSHATASEVPQLRESVSIMSLYRKVLLKVSTDFTRAAQEIEIPQPSFLETCGI
jgi:hypothetical protein